MSAAQISSITLFYQNILQRTPDSAGLLSYVGQAANGRTLDSIENSFVTSPEAQAFVYPIVELYQALLNRAPDQAGLNAFVNQYRGGVALSTIASSLITSGEGQGAPNSLGTTTTAAYISQVYQNILGRTASQGEINARLAQSQAFIAADVATSGEATAHQLGSALTFLTAAGLGNFPTNSGTGQLNQITVSQQTLTYTGTTGNDLFFAPTIFTPFGFQSNTIQNSNVFNGAGGNDTLSIALVPPNALTGVSDVVSPQVNGVKTIQIANSPGTFAANLGGNLNLGNAYTSAGPIAAGQLEINLANSNGYQQLDAVGDAGSGVVFRNATAATGTSIQNGANTASSLVPNGGQGLQIQNVSLLNAPNSVLFIPGLTSSTLSVAVNNSGGSTASPINGLIGSSIYLNSFSSTAFLQTLNLNLTSGSTASQTNQDTLNLIENGFFFAGGAVDATNLSKLAVTSVGNNNITINQAVSRAVAVTVSSPTGAAASGTLGITGAPLTKLQTFDSTAYLGSLVTGALTTNLATAAGTGSVVTGTTAANAGLTVASPVGLTSIATGAGNDVVNLIGEFIGTAFTVNLGAGNDTLFLGNTPGSTKAGAFDGGTGTNTIGIGLGALTTGGDTFANFQVLEVGPNADGALTAFGGQGIYNLAKLPGLTTVTITGSGTTVNGIANTSLGGAVTLDNAPDSLNILVTASKGVSTTTQFPLTVNLGSVAGNAHTLSLSLNANDANNDGVANGVVTFSNLSVSQATGTSASFIPGSYTETVNIASNINTPDTTPVPIAPALYVNTIGTLNIPDATALNVTNQASLNINAVTYVGSQGAQQALLSTITVGTPGGTNNTGNVNIAAFADAALTSVTASNSVGGLTMNVDHRTPGNATGAAKTNFAYVGTNGTTTATPAAFPAVQPAGGGAGTGTTDNFTFNNNNNNTGAGAANPTFATASFTGGAGNDFFTLVNSQGGNTFVYKAASDAQLTDNRGSIQIGDGGDVLATGAAPFVGDKGLTINNQNVKISVETISGFTATTTTNAGNLVASTQADTVDLRALGVGSADVFITGAAGTAGATLNGGTFVSPISDTLDLTSVPGLFTGQTGEYDRTAANIANKAPGAAIPPNPAVTPQAGAFLYQADANDVYIFVDANNDKSFTASADLAVRLYSAAGFTQPDMINLAADLKFA